MTDPITYRINTFTLIKETLISMLFLIIQVLFVIYVMPSKIEKGNYFEVIIFFGALSLYSTPQIILYLNYLIVTVKKKYKIFENYIEINDVKLMFKNIKTIELFNSPDFVIWKQYAFIRLTDKDGHKIIISSFACNVDNIYSFWKEGNPNLGFKVVFKEKKKLIPYII